ncbi:hypothetical protein GFB56_00255 [Ensifer sp. T173]|uniref:Tail assembly chaperone n=1 Tax=Ensifer canadensis TaxID=555315 RepID=A0AAW4FDS7_9HYPH|nr:hypothetical protein [Ensifer canadensis]MBM3089251.1 hypothetical protein [Ensifer canadensis]UBI76825.1 hypothetical protein J3R84_06770 [Ensifer canadensis]
MTYQRPAYEQVTIAHGDHTVTLRPTLRVAATLVERHGFPALFRAVDDSNLSIISEIILTAATNRQDAARFLFFQAREPLLLFFIAVRQSLAELISMFQPATDPKASPSTGKGKPATWQEAYAALYGYGTGWLGWTQEATWTATPTEIDRAYSAHIDRLVMTGVITRDEKTEKAPDPEQVARNVAAGLDPEFDRAGIEALRGSIMRAGR